MVNSDSLGGAAASLDGLDFATMSKADLAKLLEVTRQNAKAEADRAARLDGISIVYDSGVLTRKDGTTAPWANVTVKGGVFGWKGVKLTPAKFARLVALKDDIESVMRQHWSDDAWTNDTPA
jgi:hypothetical protein